MSAKMDDCSCGGHGPGHIGGGDGQCCGRHVPMSRFMETCLLLLLSDGADHGYSLSEKLGEFGFEDINVSTLYRVMRRMEQGGWVQSQWAQGGKGPQKRVYTITARGKEALAEEITVFEQRRQKIDVLLSRYRGMQSGGNHD